MASLARVGQACATPQAVAAMCSRVGKEAQEPQTWLQGEGRILGGIPAASQGPA